MLKWCYIILFILQVIWLIRTCCRKRKFWPVLTGNILSAGVSVFLLWYFDTLPGYGMIPGFAFFPEVFASLCSAAAFILLSFVTLLCWLLHNHK